MSTFYEEGRYLGRIENQALGKAKTGTAQFILRFTVLGKINPSDQDGDLIRVAQYERTIYRAITDKTIPYLLEDLQTLGFDGDSFKQLDPNHSDFCDFRGKEVEVFCRHEEDQQGDPREKWGIAKPRGEFDVTPLESAKVRELDNLFGKQLKGIRTAAPKQQAKPQAAAAMATNITDDDVPF